MDKKYFEECINSDTGFTVLSFCGLHVSVGYEQKEVGFTSRYSNIILTAIKLTEDTLYSIVNICDKDFILHNEINDRDIYHNFYPVTGKHKLHLRKKDED